MNNRNLLMTVLITLLLGSSFSAYSGGGSGDRKISYIEVTSTGAIIIQSAQTRFNNPDACRNPYRIVMLASNVDRNLYYAAALTAYSTDNYIWAYLNGCWDAPWGDQYPIIVNAATRSAH